MEIQERPIHHLILSSELKARGIRRPDAASLDTFSTLGPVAPCVVTRDSDNNRFEILANEEIWFAAQAVGVHSIPVVEVFPATADERQRYVDHGITDTTDPITEAERYHNWLTEKPRRRKAQLARLEGCTRSHISHQIRLLSLEQPIKEWIRGGELSSGHGKELLKLPDGAGRVRLAQLSVQRQWSVRALREYITNRPTGETDKSERSENPTSPTHPNPTTQNPKDPNVVTLEQRLSERIGSPVRLNTDAGVLEINYLKNLDVLDGILGKLGYQG